jgi:PAS domain S-box-containing protein
MPPHHQDELGSLERRLSEAEETIAAIRRGEVDALVVGSPPNEKIYTLESADQPYRIFVENMAEGAITLAHDGTILYANKRFAEIVETPLEQIVGSFVTNFLTLGDQKVFAGLQRRLKAGESRGEVRLLVAKGGLERICQVALAPLPSDSDEIFCAVFTDLTALKKAEEALQQARNELEHRVADRTRELAATVESLQKSEQQRTLALQRAQEAQAEAEASNGAKDRFLATLSHELRTPLNAIYGWIQLMRMSLGDQPVNDTLDEGLNVVERSTRFQSKLIEDLLDVSRIVSGKIQLDYASVDIAAVVDAAIESLLPVAEAADITIEQEIPHFGGAVRGDASRLQQVVWNLLSNAIKFTARGGKVRVHLAQAESEVQITISDTGQGIAPKFLDHLFEQFTQADSSSTRQHRGLGLGLAIVRNLVELHGGTVQAFSEGEGKGATFTVELPWTDTRLSSQELASAVAALPERGTALPAPGDLAGVHVLTVDDDTDSQELLRNLLSHSKARVTQSATAKAALESVRMLKPDILLCDIEMPGEDGLALIQRIRRLDPTELGMIPAVALTAYASSTQRALALQAGFQAHIAKPFDYGDLVTVIAKLVGRS